MFFYTFMPKLFNMSLTASVAIVLVMDKYGKFVDECKFFPCKSSSMYVPEWSGDARFIIISNTPEAELLERYSEIMAFLSPYILLDGYIRKGKIQQP